MTAGQPNLVSVVIPCFNAGAELAEAVNSALMQTYENLEVVIVDDGSTNPATREMLENCAWPRTRVLFKENGGPASARNLAIEHSAGKYVLPLDSDDVIAPTYIEKAVAILDGHPDVGIVYCKATKFGAETGPWNLPAYSLRELVIDNVIFVTSLFRKEDWSRVGGFSEALKLGVEDYDFWIKIVATGKEVHQIDEQLFHYRVGHASRTTGFMEDRSAIVKTYADIFRNNKEFFSTNAEFLFEHRFGLYDELLRYRARYGPLERFLIAHPKLERIVKSLYRRLFRKC